MTHASNIEQFLIGKWQREQLKEKVRKNRYIQKIRKELQNSRAKKFFNEKIRNT